MSTVTKPTRALRPLLWRLWRRRLGASALLLLLDFSLLAGAASCKRVDPVTPPDATSGTESGATATGGAQPADWDAYSPGRAGPDAGLDEAPPEKRPAPTPVSSREQAFTAIAAGNYEGAVDFLGPLVTRKPSDHAARRALFHAQLILGRYADAEALLAAGKLRTLPAAARADALRDHARLARLRGDLKGAETHLRDALKARPDDLAITGELLELLVASGRREDSEARALMDKLYDAYDAGTTKGAAQLIAVAQAALGRGTSGAFHDANMVLGEAEQSIAKARQAGQDPLLFLIEDRLLLLRGAVFTEKYASSEAAETYGILLERDAWHPDALAGVAAVMLRELRLADATRAAERALVVNPKHPDAHALLGRISAIEGRHDEARARVQQQVFSINPEHIPGLAVIGALDWVEGARADYQRARDRVLARIPDGGDFFTLVSDLLVYKHLYPEADEVLADAAAIAPRNPYVQSAYGLNLLRLGHEPRGREALAQAWKRDRFNERTRNVLDLFDNKIDRDYTLRKRGKQLELRLPTEDHELIEDSVAAAIQRARAGLDKRYGLDPGPLRVEMFNNPTDFSIRTIGVPSLGAVGVCFGPVITLIGPYYGTHNIDQVIWHELAHVYAIQLSKGRVPRWFTEGLSEWESEVADPSWARESAELLAAAQRKGKLRKLHELELAFLRAESPVMMEVAYSEAAYAIRYLGETYGLPALIKVLKGYAEGRSTEALFRQHLGKDMPAIERDFETWLKKQLATKIGGWHPTPARGDGSPAAGADQRDALYKRALEQASQSDFDGASRTLQQLIQNGGDGFPTRMLLAEVLLQGPSWKSARKHLEQARGFHREAIEPLVKLAEFARRTSDIAAEKAVLKEAVQIDALSLDPAARLLMLARVTEDAALIDLAYQRTTAIAPLHPITLAIRAERLAARDKAGAGVLLQRATGGLDEGPVDTVVVVALAAAALGKQDMARELASAAQKHAGGLPKEAKQALERLLGGPS